MPILQTPDFVAVRAAVDLDLDETVIADAVIAQDVFRGLGEQDVLDRDPLAATYAPTSVEGQAVKRAAILFVAARVIRSLSMPVSEVFPSGYRYSLGRQPTGALDPESKAAWLIAEAYRLLDSYLDVATPDAHFAPMFATLRGSRGA